jgi:hypothetical protein
LLAATFICAYENKKYSAYILAVVLFFVRPESWLLAFALPFYFNHHQQISDKNGSSSRPRSYVNRTLIIEILILSAIVAVFLAINFQYFNLPLPNAFYVKSGRDFSPLRFLVYLLYIIPVLLLIKNRYFSVMCFAFFGALALNYSKSELMMDYASRFTYHLVAPLGLVLNYVLNKNKNKNEEEVLQIQKLENKCNYCKVFNHKKYFPLILCILFSLINLRDSYVVALYYQKLLGAHGELGIALKTDIFPQKISLSIADAGIVPYNSALVNFDYIGLGSKEVAQKGVSNLILEKYNPAVVILYADQYNTPFVGFNQDKMLKYIREKNMIFLCSVKFDDSYYLSVYSNEELPSVVKVCENSRIINTRVEFNDYVKTVLVAPWTFWRAH